MKSASLFTVVLMLACHTLFAQGFTSFHDYGDSAINGGGYLSFSQYAGKKVMVVNTASYCTYTPQYAQLQALYDQYRQYNFEIIGFPCNDFAAQEPKPDSNIVIVCQNYNITFQMMSKVQIITGDTAPVYKWLQRADMNGVSNAQITWNFNKFLIDEAGNWVRHILSPVSPLDTSITNWIMTPSVVGVGQPAAAADAFELISANPATSAIELLLKNNEWYDINIYNNQGQVVSHVFNKTAAQNEAVRFDAGHLPAGIYMVGVQTAETLRTIRVALVK
jgi:glutathione peroxidase